jgi:hypothetical protein
VAGIQCKWLDSGIGWLDFGCIRRIPTTVTRIQQKLPEFGSQCRRILVPGSQNTETFEANLGRQQTIVSGGGKF